MEHYYGTLEHDDTKCTQVQWHGMASLFAGLNGVLFSEMKGAWLAEWKIRLQGVGLRLDRIQAWCENCSAGSFIGGFLRHTGLVFMCESILEFVGYLSIIVGCTQIVSLQVLLQNWTASNKPCSID